MLKNFIWSGDVTQTKICTVAWRVLCNSKEEGGLAIKDPRLVNTASLLQLCWSLVTSEEQWAHMSRARYLKHGKPINYNIASSIRSGLKSHLSLVYEHSSWTIGNGKSVNFWTGKWLTKPIVESLNIPTHLHSNLNMRVSDYILDGHWNIPDYLIQKHTGLAQTDSLYYSPCGGLFG
jgi:hypothetical protein